MTAFSQLCKSDNNFSIKQRTELRQNTTRTRTEIEEN